MLDLSAIQRVAVGSTNPVKEAAVKKVLEYFCEHQVEVVALKAPSGVSSMPISEEETLDGSYLRAHRCMEQGGFDMAFGLEGGLDFMYDILEQPQCYLFGCCTVIDKEGVTNTGWGGKFALPQFLADQLEEGAELGPLMDELRQMENTKQQNGAIGFFSKDFMTRQESFEHIVTNAFVPWVHKELYTK